METKVKAAVYARVSRLLGQCVNNQLVPLKEYCERRGFDLTPDRMYTDEGQSGAKCKRPALDRLIRDARAARFNVLVVVRLDRLGRNVAHLLSVVTELHTLGITFHSMTEGFDTKTAHGQFTMTVLAAVAQMERELIRTRIREALAARKIMAASTGWRCGRKNVVTPELAKQILELRARGRSLRSIEAALDKKVSYSVVSRFLADHARRCENVPSNVQKILAISSTDFSNFDVATSNDFAKD